MKDICGCLMFLWKFWYLIRRLINFECVKSFVEMCCSCSIRYSFKRCLALTVFLFKCRFFAKFLQFNDPSGRSAAGRMAPMAQFPLPALRVVNPTELSARFCGERSRFSLWVRAANMSWRGSDRPMKCEHVSPRVYAALTVLPSLQSPIPP